MKLNTLTIQARGRKRRIAFTAPVTIISGPNGAGKSTVLSGVELALAGTVTVDGKARKLPGDVFAHMSSGPAVAVFASYDCGEVSRTITRTAKGATQDLTFSGSPGAKIDGCQAAIAEQIGDLARVNVADLFSKGATDRRASILRLCRNLAKPWSMAELKASFDAAAQQAMGYDEDAAPVFAFTPDRDLGLLGSCEAHATAAADAVKDMTARIKSLQQAIDRMAEQTAEGASAGDSDAMAARIAELSAEIERLTAEASSIDGGNRTADVLQRRLDELAALPTVELATAQLAAAREQLAGAEAVLAGIAKPVPPVEPADMVELRREIAEQQKIVDKAVAASDAAAERAEEIRAALRRMDAHSGAECITCLRPMDETARAALDAAVQSFLSAAAAATASGDAAIEVRDCLAIDLADLETGHRVALANYDAARAKHSRDVAQAEAAIPNARRAVSDAETVLRRAQTADAERDDLREQLGKIATGDADMLRVQIAGAVQERTDLQRRRDAVLANEATQTAYRTHIADRDEATAKLAALKVAAEAWKQVVNEVAGSAVRPFLDACNAALPTGWCMDFDPATADFRVGRGDLLVAFTALSGGERVMATAAMAAALANTAGNKWRAVILDDCDRIMGDQWADPAYPAGLFAEFVCRLAAAARGGLVDQVLMATSRRIMGAELDAIEATGAVQIVEFVESTGMPPAPTPPPAPAATNDEPDAASGEKPLTGEQRVRRALARGVSADAMSYLLETICGRPKPHPTAATMKRILGDALVAMLPARGVDAIERQIVLAATHHPVKVKTSGEQTAEA